LPCALSRCVRRSASENSDDASSVEILVPGFDELFEMIRALVMCHSPSGVEGEIDTFLLEQFARLRPATELDASGNIVATIPGTGSGSIAITAHKDEIGASVATIEDDGRIKLRPLGGSYPWIYGEGVMDLLGDRDVVQGVLSFGSRHISHASPQFAQMGSAPVKWQDAWIEGRLTKAELAAAGVRPGTRVVVGKHRKAPIRLKDDIASYTLDNKASLAILLALADRIRNPGPTVHLVATTREEIGAIGALYFTRNQPVDALIALEIAPISIEYSINFGPEPVLFVEDSFSLYHDGLNNEIRAAAEQIGMNIQLASIHGFGSDASLAMKYGHVPRSACLGFPAHNTHGFEIASLESIANCVEILVEYCAMRSKD
jgi:putative aminopeptidase FrvX